MTNHNKLTPALQYALKGWHIFPVKPDQKEPLGQAVPHGHEDASNNSKDLGRWWAAHPNANIGLNLSKSGLVCIDVDSYKENCSFDDFMKDKQLPETLTQRSASGGIHYIFKANLEHNYPGILCPGVDVKHNGYILLSPSTFNGNSYEWVNNLPIANAPEWLSTKPRLYIHNKRRLAVSYSNLF